MLSNNKKRNRSHSAIISKPKRVKLKNKNNDVTHCSPQSLKLHSLSLSGIRSYSPDVTQTINFKPLTVIIGVNGSGKTTLSEGLQFATSGTFPPFKERHGHHARSFVHHRQEVSAKEIKGTIELTLEDELQRQLSVKRQLTLNQSTMQTKTLKGSVTFRDRNGNLLWNQGTRTKTVKELNTFMSTYMGTSLAVLNNVIFVHQDDALWPMMESSEVKKRIDLILGTAKQTKALECLMKAKLHFNKQANQACSELAIVKRDLENYLNLQQSEKRVCAHWEKLTKTMASIDLKLQRLQNENNDLQTSITMMRDAHDRLAQQRQQLTQLEKIKTEFVNMVHAQHECRTEVDQKRLRLMHKQKDLTSLETKRSDRQQVTNKIKLLEDTLKRMEIIEKRKQEHQKYQQSLNKYQSEQTHLETELSEITQQCDISSEKLSTFRLLCDDIKTALPMDTINTTEERFQAFPTEYAFKGMLQKHKLILEGITKETIKVERDIETLKSQLNNHDAQMNLLDKTREARRKEMEKHKSLCTLTNSLKACDGQIKYVRLTIDELSKRQYVVHNQVWVSTHHSCPTCLRPIDASKDKDLWMHFMQNDKCKVSSSREQRLVQELHQYHEKLAMLNEERQQHQSYERLHKDDSKYEKKLQQLKKDCFIFKTKLERHQNKLTTLRQSKVDNTNIAERLMCFIPLIQRITQISSNYSNSDDVPTIESIEQSVAHFYAVELATQFVKYNAQCNTLKNALNTKQVALQAVMEKVSKTQRMLDRASGQCDRLDGNDFDVHALKKKRQHLRDRLDTTAVVSEKKLEKAKSRILHHQEAYYKAKYKQESLVQRRRELNIKFQNILGSIEKRPLNLSHIDAALKRIKTELHNNILELNHKEPLEQLEQKFHANEKELQKKRNHFHQAKGQCNVLVERLKNIHESLKDERFNEIEENYRIMSLRSEQLPLVVSTIQTFYEACDAALTRYHQEKMDEVNELLCDLWTSIYDGNDIDTIKIVSGTAKENKKRLYKYAVMIVKNSKICGDMRKLGSKGQRGLACLVIRLAFARAFCFRTDIMVLDEPTTSLDKHHIRNFAKALCRLMNQNQKTRFQLVIITHRKKFVKHLCENHRHTDVYYQIKKSADNYSIIEKRSIHELY